MGLIPQGLLLLIHIHGVIEKPPATGFALPQIHEGPKVPEYGVVGYKHRDPILIWI